MDNQSNQKNHQQIGKEQDLFTFSELVGSGLPLFTPKGTVLLRTLNKYIDKLLIEQGYEFVSIPYIAKKDLYEKSGHLEKFSEDMFPAMKAKGREYILKPANYSNLSKKTNVLQRFAPKICRKHKPIQIRTIR
jgi:threonyl-tRNA synthetase